LASAIAPPNPKKTTMTTPTPTPLAELDRDSSYGREVERNIPQIDICDYFNRKAKISDTLWEAATGIGVFQLFNHGIPQTLIDDAFALSSATKEQYLLKPGISAGWDCMAQMRPSTGTADRKESYQITLKRMGALWPTGEELNGFKETILAFEWHNWAGAQTDFDCLTLRYQKEGQGGL
jgi:hypothetical protein